MYSAKVPEIHEIVFVKLSDNNLGDNYVNLVEYDDLEGLVLCTEITKWKSNLKSLVKRDEVFPVVVIGNANGGLDLSYSKIRNNNRDLLKECYESQKKLYNIISDICEELKVSDDFKQYVMTNNFDPNIYIESINQECNLPLQNYNNILQNPSKLFERNNNKDNQDNFNNIANDFCNLIMSKIIIKPYYTEKDFKLTVFDNNSLTILKQILHDVKNIKLDFNFDIMCKSSPIYQIKIIDADLDKIKENYDIIFSQINNIINNYKTNNINVNCEIIDNLTIIKQKEIYYH